MTIDAAIAQLTATITGISPDAVIKTKRRSDEEAAIRVYAPADHEAPIKNATRDMTLALLTGEGISVEVLVYDIATSLPQEGA